MWLSGHESLWAEIPYSVNTGNPRCFTILSSHYPSKIAVIKMRLLASNIVIVVPCGREFKNTDSLGCDFCLAESHGSSTTTCAKTFVYILYRFIFGCSNRQCILDCVLHVLTVHSNRRWPHNLCFVLPPVCPTFSLHKFQVTSLWLNWGKARELQNRKRIARQ